MWHYFTLLSLNLSENVHEEWDCDCPYWGMQIGKILKLYFPWTWKGKRKFKLNVESFLTTEWFAMVIVTINVGYGLALQQCKRWQKAFDGFSFTFIYDLINFIYIYILFAFCVDLFTMSNQNKCSGCVNWWSVKRSLMQRHKHKATGLVLCFPADILLITADSQLQNCWSWMPQSECVQSQMRRGKVSSLLVRAWVEADPNFPMRPCQFYSTLRPSSSPFSCPPPPPLPPPPHPAAVPGTCELLCTH